MSNQKSPFKGFTVSQVFAAEANTYVIQVGKDLFCYNGKHFFSEKSAVTLYNKILANLVDLITNGTKKQKEEALMCLSTLRVMPLRIN